MNIIRTDCPAPHYGECDAVLSPENTLATVEAHGFTARVTAETVEAWEPSFTLPLDGVSPPFDSSAWVTVPRGVHALAEWLGY